MQCTDNVDSHINGTPEELLDRFAVSELCRAWPVYRDASEWRNYRDAWADKGSYLWTSKLSLIVCLLLGQSC